MMDKRKTLSQLIQSGNIPKANINQALIASHITPQHADWKQFISNLLLLLGALAIACSVVFFIAYNWDDLSRFAKFALVEALMALAVGVYWKTNQQPVAKATTDAAKAIPPLVSQVALLVASIFLGVLLAFFGQTYQTGADTWQLFFTWAVLIIPWAIVARFPALWMLWLVLINLSIVFYFQAFRGLFGVLFTYETDRLWMLVAVNSVALVIAELLRVKLKSSHGNWAIRVIAFASGAPFTFLVLNSIFGSRHPSFLPELLWIITMAVILFVYRKLKPDLFMLAMACLSGIFVITGFVARLLMKGFGDDLDSFFLLALLVIGMGGASAVWLKKVHQEIAPEEETS